MDAKEAQEKSDVVKFREKSTLLKIEPSICHLANLYSCFFLKSVAKKTGLH